MLRYQPKDYAKALLESLKTFPKKEEEILRSFVRVLASHNDFSKWRRTSELFEKLHIQEYGEKHIEVHMARDDSGYRKKVLQALPRGSKVIFRIDPSLIGGIKVFINKETLIDGSISKRVNKLFSH
jgi:F0F1-type ATP synthase delta subunit